MARQWTEYPGLELVEPPSISATDGKSLYWLRCNLDAAITALAAEDTVDVRL